MTYSPASLVITTTRDSSHIGQVMGVLSRNRCSRHNRVVNRCAEEADYVLPVLYHMREQVLADPQLFDVDALERINRAIADTQHVREAINVRESRVAS